MKPQRVLEAVVAIIGASKATTYQKIDTHAHFLPPGYRTALESNGFYSPDGFPIIPTWSEEAHLELMRDASITKSILSISTPGTHLVAGNDALARNVTTYCNNFAADLKKRRPEQFGFWANLPLPDIPGTLAEIARAFDELNADGVAVLTNAHGVYLGDHKFDAVFEALNQRNATVFIHPTTPYALLDGSNATLASPLDQYPRPMFEFLFETARAVINLFLSGTVSRNPNVTFIIAHMGGALPPLIRRFASFPKLLNLPNVDPLITPEWVQEKLNKQFYFDSAGWPFPEQINGLLQHVTVDRLLYGSDYCYTPAAEALELNMEQDKYLPQIFPKLEDREKLCCRNAERLLTKAPS